MEKLDLVLYYVSIDKNLADKHSYAGFILCIWFVYTYIFAVFGEAL